MACLAAPMYALSMVTQTKALDRHFLTSKLPLHLFFFMTQRIALRGVQCVEHGWRLLLASWT